MRNSVLVHGRLTSPTRIELDHPVFDIDDEVDVIVRLKSKDATKKMTASEFLSQLPPGTRSREDIDRQIQEEKDSWGDR